MHTHDFDEIMIVQSGSGMHILNGNPHLITCGEVFYVSSDDYHEYEHLSDVYLVNVLFRKNNSAIIQEIVRSIFSLSLSGAMERRHWQVTDEVLLQARRLIDAMACEAQRKDQLAPLMAESLFTQLGVLLLRGRFASTGEGIPAEAKLGHMLNYLRHNYAEDLSLDDLAERFGVSLRSLNQMFRDATATTPRKYLIKLRLCAAMRRLRETDDSVTDIAFATGFNDSNYFSFCFSKECGLSPSEYRRQARRPGAEGRADCLLCSQPERSRPAAKCIAIN